MREILFRGFNKKNNQWLYGFYLRNRGAHFVCPDEFAVGKSWEDYEVDPYTVGQYTGLLDKNGTKIFEGDIIDFTNVDYPDCEIIYDNGAFVCNEIGEDNIVCELHLRLVNEVIGNIHDNPESIQL